MKRKENIMRIHVYPNWKTSFDSKNGIKGRFSYETKASKSFVPTRRMCLWCQSWKERIILCESMFSLIEWRTLSLKLEERGDFLLKPKRQNHLSQQWGCVYSTQSRKERRLLCESMFIPFERRTSIPKRVKREVFLMKPKHQNHLSH